jgi:LmbE family N-acetylglucosaminyl deacetylase
MFGERVLLLIPHPDDELVGAAAAIERLRHDGGQAIGLYLTTGVPASAGSWFGGRRKYEDAVARRWQEATEVAEELDLSPAGHRSVPSRELKSDLERSLRWVLDQATSLRPDCIWVPAYEGGHQDHDVANFLGARLRESFEVWEFSEYHYAKGEVHSQSFIAPNGTEKTLVLDDREQVRKKELLAHYRSERQNLGYVAVEREVFRPLVRYDYTRRPHEGRCFYERFHWVPFHPRIGYCRADQVCEALRAIA